MAAAPFRPPWFGNVGVQVLAGIAVVYNLYQLVTKVIDEQYGEAFLSFAWTVVFGYVLLESLRARKAQQTAVDDEPAENTD
ncbi:hypothetical protein [Modestobacter versicolor]|uniref:Uncharacterized protein n=1 Tax=Modestobacter versicolor TaxID=429133 RepID=A0A323VSP7_9ACTN|nr:hypothetical protein [Modestobacter versicolor]MBB3674322.1 hypothetical protein [Modestobacter versicolor]PZA22058.1 hypothetical protein DMO24_07005 [Modestobacter versicolor]